VPPLLPILGGKDCDFCMILSSSGLKSVHFWTLPYATGRLLNRAGSIGNLLKREGDIDGGGTDGKEQAKKFLKRLKFTK